MAKSQTRQSAAKVAQTRKFGNEWLVRAAGKAPGSGAQSQKNPKPPKKGKKALFTFIDLFAGIGGTRLGFESAGGKCVFTSEWNKFAQETYKANFGEEHAIAGDITKVDAKTIPDHDVLVGGFPCQPFSIAGVSKKASMGRAHGFLDKTQGTLFFDVARIIKEKRPKTFLLENVKNLMSHDKGNTFKVIRETLENDLGYKVFFRVIDGGLFVPQHRERIFIIGFRDHKAGAGFSFDQVKLPKEGPKMSAILHPEDGSEKSAAPFTDANGKVDPKYILTPKLWAYLQAYAKKHQAAGNGFGFGMVGKDDRSRTLSARYHKDGSEILVSRGKGARPRRLTPRECARIMGFPESFKLVCSDTQIYRQFGNSVVTPLISALAKAMAPHIGASKK